MPTARRGYKEVRGDAFNASGSSSSTAQPASLRRNGRAVALEPQPAKALALLLSRAGDVDQPRGAARRGVGHGYARRLRSRHRLLPVADPHGARRQRRQSALRPDHPEAGVQVHCAGRRVRRVQRVLRLQRVRTSRPSHGSRWSLLVVAAAGLDSVWDGWSSCAGSPDSGDRVVIAVSVFDNETGWPSTIARSPGFPISSSNG